MDSREVSGCDVSAELRQDGAEYDNWAVVGTAIRKELLKLELLQDAGVAQKRRIVDSN